MDMMLHENTLLREQVDYLSKKLYGKSSEKTKDIQNSNQISLFEIEEEVTQEDEGNEEDTP